MKFRIAVASLLISAAAGSTSVQADVVFANTYTDAAGTGFFDPTYGAARQAAWQYAENIWSGKLLSTYTVGTETISVTASFQNLGGDANSAVVGNAQAVNSQVNFGSLSPKYKVDTVYVGALANHLAGTDLSPGTAEIQATFNSNIDSGTVVGGRTFYYGLDGNPSLTPPSQIDFVTIALHELAHGLGIVSSVSSTGTFANAFGLPNAFDQFLYRGSTGQYLVDEPVGHAGNVQRAADVTSGDLYFRSATTILLDGVNGEKLYAPSPFEPGSSISHIDKTLPDLMNPNYTGPKHDPSANDLAILSDIGWDVTSIPEPASLALLGLGAAALLGRRNRPVCVSGSDL